MTEDSDDSGDSDVSFEVEINEAGTCLQITAYANREMSLEEYAAYLQDFIEDLRNGEEHVTQLVAKDH